MTNFLVFIVITVIIALACYKLIADKKKGVQCSGCPYSGISEKGCHCCDQSASKTLP